MTETRQTTRMEQVEARLLRTEEHNASVTHVLNEISHRLSAMEEKLSHPSPRRTVDTSAIDDDCSGNRHGTDGSPCSSNTTPHRQVRIELPRFHGQNPMEWLFKAEQYFHYYNIAEELRFTIASVHMDGPAFSWFKAMHTSNQLSTWSNFKMGVQERFGPSPYRDLKGELFKITQTSTVQEYYDRFEDLANQIPDLSPSSLQSCFESGLRPDIHREVRALQPPSLSQALQLAKLMEDRLADKLEAPSPVVPRQAYRPPILPTPTYTPPLMLGPPQSHEPSLVRETSTVPIHRLTPAQMDERRAKGLCFKCNDKFHRGHVCKTMFMLAVDYDDGEGTNQSATEVAEPVDYG